eukprot:1121469-Pleurochrysis_carterae.AAC.1
MEPNPVRSAEVDSWLRSALAASTALSWPPAAVIVAGPASAIVVAESALSSCAAMPLAMARCGRRASSSGGGGAMPELRRWRRWRESASSEAVGQAKGRQGESEA